MYQVRLYCVVCHDLQPDRDMGLKSWLPQECIVMTPDDVTRAISQHSTCEEKAFEFARIMKECEQ